MAEELKTSSTLLENMDKSIKGDSSQENKDGDVNAPLTMKQKISAKERFKAIDKGNYGYIDFQETKKLLAGIIIS
jgi:Ca2+-binding EF-hand superfamily protein